MKTNRGTGNILRDLISTTLVLQRCKLPQRSINKIGNNNICQFNFSSPLNNSDCTTKEFERCDICGGGKATMPFHEKEMKTLLCLLKNKLSTPLSTTSLLLRCRMCAATLDNVAKLLDQIGNIEDCLVAVIRTKGVLSRGDVENISEECLSSHEESNPDRHDLFLDLLPFGPTPSELEEEVDLKPIIVGTEVDLVDGGELMNFTLQDTHEEDGIQHKHGRNVNPPARLTDIPNTSSRPRCKKYISGKGRKYKKQKNKVTMPNVRRRLALSMGLRCPHCSKGYNNSTQLHAHIRVNHEGLRFRCTHCHKAFKSAATLDRHKKNLHSMDKISSCDVCQLKFKSKEELFGHIELEHFPNKSRCPYGCPQKFETEDEWEAHLTQCKSSMKSEESLCSCTTCDAIFRNQFLKIAHLLRYHGHVSCQVCGSNFTCEAHMETHLHLIHIHMNPGTAVEPVGTPCIQDKQGTNTNPEGKCGDDGFYLSATDTNVKAVIAGVELEFKRQYQQENNGIEFKSSRNSNPPARFHDIPVRMKSQGSRVRSKKSILVQEPIPKTSMPRICKPVKALPCPHCNKTFPKPFLLNRHIRVNHDGYRYHCPNCPKTFMSPEAFRYHKKKGCTPTGMITLTVETIALCQVCLTNFTSKDLLFAHIELEHFPIKSCCPYGCPINQFGTEVEWETHLQECKSPSMGEESLCYCSICGEIFRNQFLKIAHILRQHGYNSCSLCERKLTCKAQLDGHIRLQHNQIILNGQSSTNQEHSIPQVHRTTTLVGEENDPLSFDNN